MNKLLIVIVSLLSLSFPTLTNAAPQQSFQFEAGTFYLGFGGGNAKAENEAFFGEENISGGLFFIGVIGGNVFAIEHGPLSFSKKRDPEEDPSTADTQTGTTVYGDLTSLIFRVPYGSFSMYTRISQYKYIISVDGTRTDEGKAPGLGLGIDWFMTESWNIRYEIERYYNIGVSETDIVHSRLAISYYF